MITFIPAELFKPIHYYFLLVIAILVFAQSQNSELESPSNLKSKKTLGMILLVWVILIMGLRPINGRYFGDMRTYQYTFSYYVEGNPVIDNKDVFFHYFMKFCSSVMTVEMFFMLCALLYVLPVYAASRKIFKEYAFYGFAMIVFSMSFWSYGVNGIRNGMATSFFIYAISRDRKIITYLCLVLAFAVHKSLVIPIGAYLLASVYTDTRTYFKVWLLTIPLSLVLGGTLESFFLNLGLFDSDRLESYLDEEAIANTGFRFDFLLYGAAGVYAGWYFIIRKKFEDKLYKHIFNVYLIANAFWILIMRAAFSNRFAYLSWFLLGLVIVYPYLKAKFFPDQHRILGRVALAYFLFTFLLGIVLS